ncbi:MAG TPA: hypothetical protein VNF49_01490 [Candidatus Binataceae bacterium]|nr:hypothetical protein [Candidatus Binataceae bacterium]
MNRISPALLSVCAGLLVGVAPLMMSCKSSSDSTAAKAASAGAPPITGKQWRLEKEMVAADSQEDYAAGAVALRSLDAFGTMEVSKLFYHHKLIMVPAGTLLAGAGPHEKGATRVRVLDGPESGHTLWLYPESAEKMGFPAATPTP